MTRAKDKQQLVLIKASCQKYAGAQKADVLACMRRCGRRGGLLLFGKRARITDLQVCRQNVDSTHPAPIKSPFPRYRLSPCSNNEHLRPLPFISTGNIVPPCAPRHLYSIGKHRENNPDTVFENSCYNWYRCNRCRKTCTS